MSCVKLDRTLLAQVKQAFVPMPGGSAEPVAGASQMTAGMVAPMGGDPAAGGMPPMDPAAGGMPPMDPAAGGMPPMDPSMMGGMPPMDPSMMGGMPPMDPSMMGGGGQMTMSIPEFIEIIYAIRGESAPAVPGGQAGGEAGEAPKKTSSGGKAEVSSKLDQILAALQGGGGASGGMPPMDPSMMGGMPPAGPM